jgi:hypothetical protein
MSSTGDFVDDVWAVALPAHATEAANVLTTTIARNSLCMCVLL